MLFVLQFIFIKFTHVFIFQAAEAAAKKNEAALKQVKADETKVSTPYPLC